MRGGKGRGVEFSLSRPRPIFAIKMHVRFKVLKGIGNLKGTRMSENKLIPTN